MPDPLSYQKSITLELEIVKNRVRDLIGSASWGEEGRYKESILTKAINSQLPQHISTGTGFIMKKIEEPDNHEEPYKIILSKQHDIILYDNRIPLIMKYGDFIIAIPNGVKGVIEVKSNLTPAKFRDAFKFLEGSLENLLDNYNNKFIGIFSFDFRNGDGQICNVLNRNIIKTLRSSKGIVNHISLGENFFIRYWKQHQGVDLDPPLVVDNDFYNIYEIDDLSYSYFISNILHRTCENIEERYWHSFPIIKTKEQYRRKTIELIG